MIKRTLLLLGALAALGVLLLLSAVGSFLWSEHVRERDLETYRAPGELVNRLRQVGAGKVAELLRPGEVLACVLGAYQRPDVLQAALGKERTEELRNMRLPNEDGTWYLIFLSDSKVTRVHLMDREGHLGVELAAEGCHGPNASFRSEQVQLEAGESSVRFAITR